MRRYCSAPLLLSLLALAVPARAGDLASAEALFREGRDLMNAGDYQAACPKLKESYEHDPATGTLLALAMCQDRAGKTASAWVNYAQVAARARREGRVDREEAARERMRELEPTLSRLTITVHPSAASFQGLSVMRDGIAVGSGTWGVAVPVDPGEHVVVAEAPRKKRWSTTITIGADASTRTLEVPPLEDLPPEPVAAPAISPAPVTRPEPSHDRASGGGLSTLQVVAIGTGGAGLVGLGLSGYFALRAQSAYDESNEGGHCNANNQCDATGSQRREDASSLADAATVSFVAGSVLAAAGVVLFVLGTNEEQVATRVEAAVGPGSAGVILRGSL